jgi:hypothetical protein
MSLTRSGLHHPVLPLKQLILGLFLIIGKREPLHYFKEKPPQSINASGCGKKILDLCTENTPIHTASQIQVSNY